MLLAELEVWHSRPVTPTRRVALGHLVLPVDPLPGFGGLLLGAVVAAHIADVDDELVPDLYRLVNEIEAGNRVVQPRLRHRYQVDRHGLARSTHRLTGEGEEINFSFENHGSSLQQVLGAIYAVERLGPDARHSVGTVLHRGLRWTGRVGPNLISHLAGATGLQGSVAALVDPVAWALDVLGFPPGTTSPSKRDINNRYRVRLMEVHPDHGGDEVVASRAIIDLGEARRILFAMTGPARPATEAATGHPSARRPRRRAGALLLAPGAGSSRAHPALVAIEEAVAPLPVARMDFPYRKAGRKAPDRAPVLVAAVRAEADALVAAAGVAADQLVLGGRSMGGRMCSLAVAEGLPAAGLVLISYPLHPPGRPDRLRTDHLPAIGVPCLFVQGDRDPFGTPDELQRALELVPGDVTSEWIEGGRHDLKGSDARVADVVAGWLRRLGPRRGRR